MDYTHLNQLSLCSIHPIINHFNPCFKKIKYRSYESKILDVPSLFFSALMQIY